MDPIIEVRGVSKKYNISHLRGRYVALRDVLANILLHPFAFLKQKVAGGFSGMRQEDFWALKDVSFDIFPGEIVGLIGRNGAGKSTLLKILSRITPPTTGEIRLRGRVGSLLEVGTGFHSELTGRENIFLNGAILGMSKKEIERKFDDIVEFAGVEKFIDTPVKHYSSGMFVRLAFAVAAHLEPDILLVDEVLAVGDAEFQKKSLGKMEEVTKTGGRTIIFVSHNMAAVKTLCKKCILLEDGRVSMVGETNDVVNYYLNRVAQQGQVAEYRPTGTDLHVNEFARLEYIRLVNEQGVACSDFGSTDDIIIEISYEIMKEIRPFFVDCYLHNAEYVRVFHTTDNDVPGVHGQTRVPGRYITRCRIPKNLLNVGRYILSVGGRTPNVRQFFAAENALTFQVSSSGGPTSISAPRIGVICPALEWVTTNQ